MGSYGRGTSGWGAGCGIAGLVGLLASIVIAVWLSSEVAKNASDVDDLSGALGADPLVVTVAPRTNLVEGQEIHILVQGIPVATAYKALQCAQSEDEEGCVPVVSRLAGDAHGRYDRDVPIHRLLQTPTGNFDCAARGTTCELRIATDERTPPVAEYSLRFRS